MEETLIEYTNKASLHRLSEDMVLKRYITEDAIERVIQDQRSLLQIQECFGAAHYKGWKYRIVKLLWLSLDQRALGMEFVSGRPLSKTDRSNMQEAELHCGIWLGLYHNKMLDGQTQGLIYTDFIVHNIILDFDKRSVTVIDPGMAWGRQGYIYEDLLQHITSMLLVLVIRRKSSFSAVGRFLDGYMQVANAKLNLVHYYGGLLRELRRQFLAYNAKSRKKSLFFLMISCLMLPIYVIFIPAFLYRRQSEGAVPDRN